MKIQSFGAMSVDWEERINYDRLRKERLTKGREALQKTDQAAFLCFDMNNIRYLTSTTIGEWARDKLARFCLLFRDEAPILWDFGSAAASHRLHAPWNTSDRWRAGVSVMRGAMTPETGIAQDVANKVRVELEKRGLLGEPVGVDVIEAPVLFALQASGIPIADAQQPLITARMIKTEDEINLLNTSAMMVDAAYDLLYENLRPGVRENDLVALATAKLIELGSDQVEGINAISGERCSPHPHIYSDRVIRPGDQAYFDILQAFQGYRTCYYRTFAVGNATPAQRDAYKICRDYLDASIDLVKPGTTTRQIAEVWPKAQEFGFANEEEAFALQFGHGVGLSIWEKPVISRLVSLKEEVALEPGMVFALETFWPARDGYSAARIEEEVVVTPTGHQVITRFPAEELIVAGARYYTTGGAMPGMPEIQPRWSLDAIANATGNGATPTAAPDPVPLKDLV
ncbi:MAG TPA: Xaa-Pro peptidase family protein [Chloroflexota bacterium]|nr:Xaa-Pro peptidase family protein [Chloroflexota bacterium]